MYCAVSTSLDTSVQEESIISLLFSETLKWCTFLFEFPQLQLVDIGPCSAFFEELEPFTVRYLLYMEVHLYLYNFFDNLNLIWLLLLSI